jgi:surface antigen
MSHLLATPHGIMLAGVILAKRNADGSFAVKGNEKSIHAQLQAAYGRAVHPQAMRYINRGCELLAKVSDKELEQAAYPFHPNPHAKTTSGNDFSDLTKGLMMFALTGLNDMENIAQGKARLLKIQASIHHDSLLKSYGLPTWEQLTKDDGDDEEDDDEDDEGDDDGDSDSSASTGGGNGHYNPDEPRIPAGQPGGGQWTKAGNGVSSDSGSISADDIRTALREDFDTYDPSAQPQGTQVAANDTVQSDAAPAPVSNTNTFDAQNAAQYIQDNAESHSTGRCAHYVTDALNNDDGGGLDIVAPDSGNAKDYGPSLENQGFQPVASSAHTDDQGATYPPTGYTPQTGDVVVMDTYPSSKNQAGHMAMYDGTQWVSDWEQRSFWPSSHYSSYGSSYVIYRHPASQ